MSLKTAQDNQTMYRQKKTQKTRKKGSSHMNIGIIGSGNIGANAARLFAKAGHQVAIANSRGPETLEGVVEQIGPNVRATNVEEAATFGELAMEAIPFGRYEELPREALSGRIVVSASNYYPGRDGALDLGGLAQTEALARHLSGSRVVKAFNTIYHERLANEGRPGAPLEERLAIFVAGDDEEAKRVVSTLIEEIGFAPVDTGTLAESRRQEPGAKIYNTPLTATEARELLSEERW